jgi:hypothetical protein
VEQVWLICPHCEAVLQGQHRGARGGKLDDLLHRQSLWLQAAVIALATVGGLAFAFAGMAAFWGMPPLSKLQSLLVFVSGVVFLGLTSTGIMSYRTRDDPGRRSIVQVIVGTLALAGGLAAVSCVVGVVVELVFMASWAMGY